MQIDTVPEEFDFNTEYCKGASSINEDPLSCCHEEGTRQQDVAATFLYSGEKDL